MVVSAAGRSRRFAASPALRVALAAAWGTFALGGLALFVGMSGGGLVENPTALARRTDGLLRGKTTPADLAEAERLTRREISFGPYRAAAWCRLAHVQRLAAGRLDVVAAESLRRSYEVAPYSSEVFLWRTEFAFDNWAATPPDVKQHAIREVRAFYSQWSNRQPIELMAARVEDPAGRLAIELLLFGEPRTPKA